MVRTAAPSTSSGVEPASPARAVASAVLQVLSPPPSAATQTTMLRLKCSNDFRKRRRGASVASDKDESELSEDLRSWGKWLLAKVWDVGCV